MVNKKRVADLEQAIKDKRDEYDEYVAEHDEVISKYLALCMELSDLQEEKEMELADIERGRYGY